MTNKRCPYKKSQTGKFMPTLGVNILHVPLKKLFFLPCTLPCLSQTTETHSPQSPPPPSPQFRYPPHPQSTTTPPLCSTYPPPSQSTYPSTSKSMYPPHPQSTYPYLFIPHTLHLLNPLTLQRLSPHTLSMYSYTSRADLYESRHLGHNLAPSKKIQRQIVAQVVTLPSSHKVRIYDGGNVCSSIPQSDDPLSVVSGQFCGHSYLRSSPTNT